MPESAQTTPVTIGTAGHIDHGKTLLVEKLTGMRADRPYERERGMTIDIGYAEMTAPDGQRIGFVDLPGHERFIRNMVAGASGIDLALLVVAADDGVMPQTREHMEILDLLGVNRGVVVLNKVDLVDEEMRELALEELSEFLEDTGLKDAPILACSAETGEGVDAVRKALNGLISRNQRENDPGAFFLAVQRTFAATGFGCIATGVPAAGGVGPGDELELLPSGKKARVRAIQVYHEPAERASAGHRTALNLSGVSKDEVERGMVVAAPGAYRPTRHIAVRLNVLSSAKRPVKHAAGARFLSGTLEEMAKIYLPSGDALMPGESAIVEIRTGETVAVKDGAPFIVRSDNAKETIGGGIVVSSMEDPIGRKDPERVAKLEAWESALSSARDRVLGALESGGASAPRALAVRCQLDPHAVNEILATLEREERATQLVDGTFVLHARLTEAIAEVPHQLERMHKKNPLLATLAVADVRDALGYSEAVLMSA
ncbi:MAG: selenocysteine-specific translation elongation factor, partial [Planctomycetota bacterium]